MPQFAHLPLLLKPDGNGKLSKRDGDRLGFPVFPLRWVDPATGDVSSGYRESGYLPEAVVNFVALLGWNPGGGESEILSMERLVDLFNIEKVSKAGAKFDYNKGRWFNHHYIQVADNELLASLLMPILTMHGVECNHDYTTRVVGLVKERCQLVPELWEQGSFFFVRPDSYDEKMVRKRWKEDSPAQMKELIDVLSSLPNHLPSVETEGCVKAWIEECGYNLGAVMNAFRLSVVGESKGPHMFDITALLGKTETIARIEQAIARLG